MLACVLLVELVLLCAYSLPGEAALQCHDCAGEQCLRSIAAGISGKCPAKNQGRCFIRLEADGTPYHGCADTTTWAEVDTSYVGCRYQESAGSRGKEQTLWCLCDSDFCNKDINQFNTLHGYQSLVAKQPVFLQSTQNNEEQHSPQQPIRVAQSAPQLASISQPIRVNAASVDAIAIDFSRKPPNNIPQHPSVARQRHQAAFGAPLAPTRRKMIDRLKSRFNVLRELPSGPTQSFNQQHQFRSSNNQQHQQQQNQLQSAALYSPPSQTRFQAAANQQHQNNAPINQNVAFGQQQPAAEYAPESAANEYQHQQAGDAQFNQASASSSLSSSISAQQKQHLFQRQPQQSAADGRVPYQLQQQNTAKSGKIRQVPPQQSSLLSIPQSLSSNVAQYEPEYDQDVKEAVQFLKLANVITGDYNAAANIYDQGGQPFQLNLGGGEGGSAGAAAATGDNIYQQAANGAQPGEDYQLATRPQAGELDPDFAATGNLNALTNFGAADAAGQLLQAQGVSRQQQQQQQLANLRNLALSQLAATNEGEYVSPAVLRAKQALAARLQQLNAASPSVGVTGGVLRGTDEADPSLPAPETGGDEAAAGSDDAAGSEQEQPVPLVRVTKKRLQAAQQSQAAAATDAALSESSLSVKSKQKSVQQKGGNKSKASKQPSANGNKPMKKLSSSPVKTKSTASSSDGAAASEDTRDKLKDRLRSKLITKLESSKSKKRPAADEKADDGDEEEAQMPKKKTATSKPSKVQTKKPKAKKRPPPPPPPAPDAEDNLENEDEAAAAAEAAEGGLDESGNPDLDALNDGLSEEDTDGTPPAALSGAARENSDDDGGSETDVEVPEEAAASSDPVAREAVQEDALLEKPSAAVIAAAAAALNREESKLNQKGTQEAQVAEATTPALVTDEQPVAPIPPVTVSPIQVPPTQEDNIVTVIPISNMTTVLDENEYVVDSGEVDDDEIFDTKPLNLSYAALNEEFGWSTPRDPSLNLSLPNTLTQLAAIEKWFNGVTSPDVLAPSNVQLDKIPASINQNVSNVPSAREMAHHSNQSSLSANHQLSSPVNQSRPLPLSTNQNHPSPPTANQSPPTNQSSLPTLLPPTNQKSKPVPVANPVAPLPENTPTSVKPAASLPKMKPATETNRPLPSAEVKNDVSAPSVLGNTGLQPTTEPPS